MGFNERRFPYNSSWLSNLKLRVSYGLTGDQEIGDFQYLSYWSPARYDGNAGLRPANIGNKDLTWQRNKMFNAGIDFEIKKGLLSGSLEVFKGNRTKLLAEAVLPATSGFPSYTTNAGNIENQGIEFSLMAYPVKQQNFSWSINFNVSYLKDKIKSLYSDNELLFAYSDPFPHTYPKSGRTVGSFWGYKYLGVDPETGDPKFSDDEQVIGKATPDYFGGLTNDFKYKNWDLSLRHNSALATKYII
jgi:outer membrane receptor protein involved in Fe transport